MNWTNLWFSHCAFWTGVNWKNYECVIRPDVTVLSGWRDAKGSGIAQWLAIVQELCESRGGRPELSVLTSFLVSVDVKNYWTVLRHWSQLVPNMSTDMWGPSSSLHHHHHHQWLERRTRDWKVVGSNPCRSGGRVFFSSVNFLCWLLFRCPFHPRVTAVARKRSRSFCRKCRWQVTAKHAYALPIWFWMKWQCNLVHGWMVYTELALKRQHFTWHQPCNNHRALPVHHFREY